MARVVEEAEKSGAYDVVVIGGGASGMVAAISAARAGRKTLICESSRRLGTKVLATGGRRCNLTNTLTAEEFMSRVKPHGRFMAPALKLLGGDKLRAFFAGLGMETVVLDGFRVWPSTRRSSTVLAALTDELARLGVDVAVRCRVSGVRRDSTGFHVEHAGGTYTAPHVVLATGGLALPRSGALGDGYDMAESLGLRTTPRYPAGVPLVTKEDWTARCVAHTVGKARMEVALPKCGRFTLTGALIFTRDGIRGPVVLDLSREISPLLAKHGEVPLLMNLCDGKTGEDWQRFFKAAKRTGSATVVSVVAQHLAEPIAEAICELAGVDATLTMHHLTGQQRHRLTQLLVKTPLTITGTTGYDGAFITRGGVRLKEVRPDTLESKQQPGLFLCGEVLDIDGPCGGFNLQWAFASGYLAGLCGRPGAGPWNPPQT